MAWFQVDDQLAMHRKVCEAGNAAMGLWVRAGAWSMQNLTEGHVPTKAARTLGTAGQAKSLVNAGLWAEVDGGYQFHEWGARQMSADRIAERRRKRAEAGRKGGQSKKRPQDEAKQEANASSNAQPKPEATAEAESKQNGTPVPVPVLSVVTKGENGTEGDARDSNDPPPRFCPKHMPSGTLDRCGACADARHQHDDWLANASIEQKRALQEQARAQAARRIAEATDRSRYIADCPLCDETGYRNNQVCDHIDRTETNRAGIQAVRAALTKGAESWLLNGQDGAGELPWGSDLTDTLNAALHAAQPQESASQHQGASLETATTP